MQRKETVNILSIASAAIGLTFVFTGIFNQNFIWVPIGVGFFLIVWLLQLFAK